MSGHLHDDDGTWDVGEVVGPYTWGALHYLAENFPCPPCADHAGALMRGFHDVINFRIGKAIEFPADLDLLAHESVLAINSLEISDLPPSGLPLGAREFPTCVGDQGASFERCVVSVKDQEVQPDSPFAVCTAAVGCSPN